MEHVSNDDLICQETASPQTLGSKIASLDSAPSSDNVDAGAAGVNGYVKMNTSDIDDTMCEAVDASSLKLVATKIEPSRSFERITREHNIAPIAGGMTKLERRAAKRELKQNILHPQCNMPNSDGQASCDRQPHDQ